VTPTTLTFVVPGPVLPWQRAVTSKDGKRHTSKEQRAYQAHVKACAWSELAKRGWLATWPTNGRYAVDVEARFPNYMVRDLDNALKQLKDAVKSVIWVDDCRVDEERIKRVISTDVGLTVRVDVLVAHWVSQGRAAR
jgi:Holliday junction resolvase RusA-like endonuclease